MTENKKIDELESIRGLAALLVVLYHVPKWNDLLNIGIINNGYLMVELFFVLSGYVIYKAYCYKINDIKDLINFQFLRFARIYPVHLLFLIIFLFIEIAKYIAQVNFGIGSVNSSPFENNNLFAFFQQLMLVQAIGQTNNAITFNGPAWSISVEFYTYLIFAFVVVFSKKYVNIIILILAAGSILLITNESTMGFSDLIRCFAGFFIGCLTGYIVKKIKIDIPRMASLLIFIILIGFINIKNFKHYDAFIYFLSSILIISVVNSRDGYLNRILKISILQWLGSISYSIYMSHAAIIWIFNQLIRLTSNKNEKIIDNTSIPQLDVAETLATMLITMIAIFIVSTLVYYFIEKPIRDKSRQFVFNKLKNR